MGIGDHQERWSQPQSVIVEFEDRRPWYLDSETSLSPIIGDWVAFHWNWLRPSTVVEAPPQVGRKPGFSMHRTVSDSQLPIGQTLVGHDRYQSSETCSIAVPSHQLQYPNKIALARPQV